MAWEDVRGKVRDLLAVVAITEPLTETVKRVYEFPPGAAPTELPCFMMMPPARDGERAVGLLMRVYTQPVQFFCRDAKAEDAANIADAYSEATFTAFEQAIRADNVDERLMFIELPDIAAVSPLSFAGQQYIGFEFSLTYRFAESASPSL